MKKRPVGDRAPGEAKAAREPSAKDGNENGLLPLKGGPPEWAWAALAFAFLAALTLAAFWKTSGFALINLDDAHYTTQNPLVNGGLSVPAVWRALTTVYDNLWIPATWISYMADVSLWGQKAGGFHRTNVILASLNAGLFFLFLRYATGSTARSFFAALFFTVHPLRVESVAWVTERKDVLAVLFFLLTLLAYVRYAKTGRERWLAAASGLALLGCMAKPVVIILPPLLLVLDYWPLKRFPEGRWRENRGEILKLAIEKWPFVALSIILAALTIYTQSGVMPATRGGVSRLLFGVANLPRAYLFYLWRTFWPSGLFMQASMPLDPMAIALAITGYLFIATSSFYALKYAEKAPEFVFGWFWYLAALLPNSGIMPAGLQIFSDRFSYIPHMGIAVAVVWGADRLATRLGIPKAAKVSAAFAAAAVLFYSTFVWAGYWKDSLTLFTQVDKDSGGRSAMAKNGIGLAKQNVGLPKEAALYYGQAFEIDPLYPSLAEHLTKAYLNSRDYDNALRLANMILADSPGDQGASVYAAMAMSAKGDVLGATLKWIENYRRWPGNPEVLSALSRYPNGLAGALRVAGDELTVRGRPAEAEKYYSEARGYEYKAVQ